MKRKKAHEQLIIHGIPTVKLTTKRKLEYTIVI